MNTNELTYVIISYLSTHSIPLKAQVSLLTFTNMSLKSDMMIIGSETQLLPAALLTG